MRERRKVGSGRDHGWWNESEGYQWLVDVVVVDEGEKEGW